MLFLCRALAYLARGNPASSQAARQAGRLPGWVRSGQEQNCDHDRDDAALNTHVFMKAPIVDGCVGLLLTAREVAWCYSYLTVLGVPHGLNPNPVSLPLSRGASSRRFAPNLLTREIRGNYLTDSVAASGACWLFDTPAPKLRRFQMTQPSAVISGVCCARLQGNHACYLEQQRSDPAPWLVEPKRQDRGIVRAV